MRAALIGLGAGLVAIGCHSAQPNMAVGASGACATAAPMSAHGADERVVDPVASFDTAWSIIAMSHWDTTFNGVNWKLVRDTLRPKAAAAKTKGELRSVLSNMIGTLHQSHFAIIPGDVSDGTALDATQDKSAGIGATFRVVDNSLLLTHVRPGGPADRAGMRAGFAVVAVDGCSIAMRFAQVPKDKDGRHYRLSQWSAANVLLGGPEGDTARIVARNAGGSAMNFAMAREVEAGKVTQFGHLPPMSAHLESERRMVGGKTVGIIRFNIWMTVLAEGLNATIDSLRDADAIVLDIRGNFGGMGAMSQGFAGHFIDSALTLGTMVQRASTQRYIINPQRVDRRNKRVRPFSGPLAIVVDELSVSTTEIFAAGMQQLGRARVFGEPTAGESLPAVAERLPSGDILYHALANFVSPNGKPVEGAGVIPDVLAAPTRQALLQGRDPALDSAVAWAASAKGPAPTASGLRAPK